MKKKSKITLLHYSCPPVIGGVESVIASHARLFASNGFEVDIISGAGGKFDDNVNFIKFPAAASKTPGVVKLLENIRNNQTAFSDYVDNLANRLEDLLINTDICIVHNVMTMHFNLALSWALKQIALKRKSIKFINWIHDCTLLNRDYTNEATRDSYPWDILRTKLDNFKYAAISTMRQKQISELFGIPVEEITVIPNGISIDSFLGLEPFVSELFKSETLAYKDIIAFTPTRILKRKNLELGIELVKSIKKHNKSIKWMITGAADPHNNEAVKYFNHLKELINQFGLQEDIVFLSEKYNKDLTDKEIESLYRLADVLFFMSRQEGFGIPVIEAALSKTLAVISDIPPLIELGEEDCICVPLKEKDLNKTACELIENFDSSMNYRLRKKSIKTYSWDVIFEEKIKPLIEELPA